MPVSLFKQKTFYKIQTLNCEDVLSSLIVNWTSSGFELLVKQIINLMRSLWALRIVIIYQPHIVKFAVPYEKRLLLLYCCKLHCKNDWKICDTLQLQSVFKSFDLVVFSIFSVLMQVSYPKLHEYGSRFGKWPFILLSGSSSTEGCIRLLWNPPFIYSWLLN